jgi:uncharacterized RDD family membrane protein YckC
MKSLVRLAPAFACAMVLAATAALAQEASARRDLPRLAPPPVSLALDVAAAEEQEPRRVVRFGRPIVRIGQDYTLKAGEDVRAVHAAFGDVTVAGSVDQDVVVVLGTVHLAASAIVKGSVIVVGGNAEINEGAVLDRDLVLVGGMLTAPPGFAPGGDHVVVGSQALGNTLHAIVPWLTRGLLLGRLIVPDLRWTWVVFGLAFLVTLGVNTLFGGAVRASAETLVAKPVTVFLVGLLVLVLTVPVIAILGVTVVGLAVVPFVLAGMFLTGLIGKAGVARAIGGRVARETFADSRLQSFRSLLFGTIVIALAYMVPVLGIVTWSLTGALAIGAAAITMRGYLRREHPARVHVPPPSAPPPITVRDARTPDAAQAPYVAPAEDTSAPPPESATAWPEAHAVAGGDLALFPRATFLDRVMAFALDCVLIGIVVLLLDLSRSDSAFPFLLLVYHVAFWAWKGTTLGGIVVGLRIIRIRGGDFRFADALVRALSSLFSLAALGIGCFWMLQDPEHQMWHDKIAGTVVVKVPRELAIV